MIILTTKVGGRTTIWIWEWHWFCDCYMSIHGLTFEITFSRNLGWVHSYVRFFGTITITATTIILIVDKFIDLRGWRKVGIRKTFFKGVEW